VILPSITAPNRSLRRRRELIGYGLLAAYIAVVGMSLWLRYGYGRENAAAREHAEEWSGVVREGTALLHHLSEIYTAGVEPTLAPEARRTRFEAARSSFATALASVQEGARQEAKHGAEELTADLAVLGASAGHLSTHVEALLREAPFPRPDRRPPHARLRAVDSRYRESVDGYNHVWKRLHDIAKTHSTEQAATARRVERLDTIMHVLLLLTIGGTTFFLYRLARQVRADVREKARLVTELRESETKYRSMFDNSVEGIFQTTPEGRFITANRALARMYGYESPEHLIERLSDIGSQLYVDPSQREALLRALQKEDVVSNFEFEAVRADGRMMWLRENVRAVRDEKGNLLYLEGTVEDVSDRWWGEQRPPPPVCHH
jgi:PAS domain S-box-containing protein